MEFVRRLIAGRHLVERGRVRAILLLAAILAALCVAYTPFPKGFGNWGFGPDWDCTQQAEGDPVCARKSTPITPRGGG